MNETLPGITPAPEIPPNTFTLLTELEISGIRKQIIEANGSIEDAGISLETMRNVIYTCRMKANPIADEEQVSKPKKPKAVAEKTPNTKLSGDEINSFLG